MANATQQQQLRALQSRASQHYATVFASVGATATATQFVALDESGLVSPASFPFVDPWLVSVSFTLSAVVGMPSPAIEVYFAKDALGENALTPKITVNLAPTLSAGVFASTAKIDAPLHTPRDPVVAQSVWLVSSAPVGTGSLKALLTFTGVVTDSRYASPY